MQTYNFQSILSNHIFGRNITSLTLVCIRNRRTDPQRINVEYPKKRRFLFKRYRVISYTFHIDTSPSRFPSKNRKIPILKGNSIWLIKWQKTGLENLLGISYIKRRIRRSAIRDYQMGEEKKLFSHIQPFTNSILGSIFKNRRLRIGSEVYDSAHR